MSNRNPLYVQEGLVKVALGLAGGGITGALLHQFATPAIRKMTLKRKFPNAASLKKGIELRIKLCEQNDKKSLAKKLEKIADIIDPKWSAAEYDMFLQQYTRVRLGRNIAALLLLNIGCIMRLFKMGFSFSSNATIDHMAKY